MVIGAWIVVRFWPKVTSLWRRYTAGTKRASLPAAPAEVKTMMKEEELAQVLFEIPASKKRKFKAKLGMDGKNIRTVLEKAIDKYLES